MDGGIPAPPGRLLEHFGVPADAESVWRALVRAPECAVADLKSETGLTGAEIDEAISELLRAELVRGHSSPSGVAVIDPTLAVETHVARAERDIASHAEALSVVRGKLPAVAAEFAQARAGAKSPRGFDVITDIHDIQQELRLASERVKTDLRSTEHARYLVDADALNHAQDALLKRGVRDRLIIDAELLRSPDVFAEWRELQARGHDARSMPGVTTRLRIYDCDLAVLPVDPSNVLAGAMFIRAQSVIDALIMMFDHMWSMATPVYAAPVTRVPRERTVQVLEQLGLGAKDEAIARNLGIGVRTIRREVADLKSTLGVHSRSEIVAAAVRKGWL